MKIKYIKLIVLIIIISGFYSCKNYNNSSIYQYLNNNCSENISNVFKTTIGLQNLKKNEIKIIGCNRYKVVDENKIEYERQNCSFNLFNEQLKSGMKLSEFSENLLIKNWITNDNFDIVKVIGGEVPIQLIDGNSVVVLRLKDFPPEGVTIYLRISEEIQDDMFYTIIKNNINNNINVLECVLIIETGEI